MSTINPVQPFAFRRDSGSEQDGAATPVTDDAFSMIGDDPTSNAEERGRYIKDLFEGDPTCQCCIKWVDEPPEGLTLDDDESEDEDGNVPLLVRRRRCHGGPKAWEVYCIEIKNPALRAVLLKVFDNYPFLRPSLKYLTFFAPFRPFYHAWDKFEEAIKEEKDGTVLNSLRILKRFVKMSLGSEPSVSKELIASGVISYSCLWTLFNPGDLLYTAEDGVDAFVRLQSISNINQLFTTYIDWDGTRFGWVTKTIILPFFIGTKEITELEAYPAHMHPNYEQLKKVLIQRGQKFSELAGNHTKTYISQEELNNLDKSEAKIGRRIIVDAKSYPFRGPPIMVDLWHEIPLHTSLIQQQPFKSSVSRPNGQHIPLDPNNPRKHNPILNNLRMGYGDIPRPPSPPPLPPPSAPQRRGKMKGRSALHQFFPSLDLEPASDGIDAELTPNELMVCNFEVKGFCLRDRRWRLFDVDRIRDVEWNEEPFNNLVLPEGYKDLILAFVESQLKQNEHFEDVMNGKGGGLVILLCGAPGVGKTLTAESVAEKIKAPLFKMEPMEEIDTVSDSSTSSYDGQVRVKRRKKSRKPTNLSIEEQFEYAKNWNAVLLFDECDAHLGKRSGVDAQEKLILNQFLQKLEYFPSLLFLTTNHAESLDPAIASRVHLTINYPTLNVESRLIIWRNFLDRAYPPAALSWEEIKLLSGIELNGRRIKNVVKTAQIMARREQRAVRLDDIKKVMRITEGLHVD